MTRTITPDEVLQHLDKIAGLLDEIFSGYAHNQPMDCEYVETLEQRVASHLRELRAHWNITLAVAARHIEHYYESRTHAGAIYVLASGEPDQPGLDIVMDALTRAPNVAVISYGAMLQRATHPELASALGVLMDHPEPWMRACAIELLGFRREGRPEEIARRFTDDHVRVRDAVVMACHHFGYRDIVPVIEQYANTQESLRADILLALLFLGSEPGLHTFRVMIENHIDNVPADVLIWLSMCGDARDLEMLLLAHAHNKISTFPALAMLGDTNSIPYLLEDLKDKSGQVQKQAHQTLKYITDADVHAPDYSLWRGWWRRHTARFSEHPRWRLGRPWSLELCIDALCAYGVPYLQRRDTYLELVIRSGHIIHFEPNWEIPRQKEAANQWRDWWDQEQHRFIDKPWPYAGR